MRRVEILRPDEMGRSVVIVDLLVWRWMLNSLLAKAFGVERWMFASNILFAFAVLCSIFPVPLRHFAGAIFLWQIQQN
jgi:hypothetical protein